MESISIKSGKIRLAINDDETCVIEFNPSDIAFAERFYALLKEFDHKQAEYRQRAEELDAVAGLDELGIPKRTPEGLALLRDICIYMREKVDYLFGAGTSQKAFGDALEIELFEQFFNGVAPFIQKARSERLKKYTAQPGNVLR